MVETLLAAATDDALFMEVPKFLSDHIGSASAWLRSDIGNAPRQPGIGPSHGIDQAFIASYAEGGHVGDPWLQAGAQIPLGRGFAMDRLVPAERFGNSMVYNELLRGRLNLFHCLVLAVRAENATHCVALQRERGAPAFSSAEEAALTALAQPLSQMIGTRRRAEGALLRDMRGAVFERLPDAALLCDSTGALQHLNAAGERLLRGGHPLRWIGNGRIAGTGPSAQRLAQALTGAVRWGLSTRLDMADPIRGRYAIRVQPDEADRQLAMIIVRDIDVHARRVVEDASRSYGFTPAEAALAAALVQGSSVEEHAGRRTLGLSTVRTQLRALLAKTGTARQGELIALLLGAPFLG